MAEMEKKKQEIERMKRIEETKKIVIKNVCEPAAYEYLKFLEKNKPSVAKLITNIILNLVVNRALHRKVNKIDVMALERRIEGRGPEIKIKRRGEDVEDLSSVFRED